MADQYLYRKRRQAKKKYLQLDEELALLGKSKVELLERKLKLSDKVDDLFGEIRKTENELSEINGRLSDLNFHISPKTIEHRFCWKIMQETYPKRMTGRNSIQIEQIDEVGNVINRYDSIYEAAQDNGLCRQTVSKICRREVKPRTHFFRYAT